MAFNLHHALADALPIAVLLAMCISAYVSDCVEANAQEDNWTTNLCPTPLPIQNEVLLSGSAEQL